MKAKVNYSAIDTWLEPYIGWEFEVVKTSKNRIWFLMDNGGPKLDITKYHAKCFDFTTSNHATAQPKRG